MTKPSSASPNRNTQLIAEAHNQLRTRIEAANGSPDGLRAVFARLESEFGIDRASGLWWSVFAETDAAPT